MEEHEYELLVHDDVDGAIARTEEFTVEPTAINTESTEHGTRITVSDGPEDLTLATLVPAGLGYSLQKQD